jgi:asparagine synthase (glutamine-hydrolysing)
MGALIAALDKRRRDATKKAVDMFKALKVTHAQTYGIASSTKIETEETIKALESQTLNSPIIVGYAFRKIATKDRLQPLKLEEAALVFDGRTYPSGTEESDAQAVARKLQSNREETAKTLIRDVDGDFAFVIAESDRLIAGRDALGIRPLYYGENRSHLALASERKALWKIGLKANSFPPGHVASADEHGLSFKPAKTLAYSEPKNMTLQAASNELRALLEHSVKARVHGLKEAAVAFSGGLDSSIVAILAKTSKVNVHLIHASLADQPEIETARKAAEELKLPIHTCVYTEENVQEILPKVVRLIEEADLLKTSVGIPIYWTARKAAEMGFNVMLAGQGADEFFGGYKKYVDCYLQHGNEKAQRLIFKDVLDMYKTNFERDFKICNFHGMELRLPFATFPIAKFAVNLPINLKMERSNRTLRKLVLRQVARNLGLPQFIAEKPKRAIQYTTGTSKILRKITKQKGVSMNEYLQKIFRNINRRCL